MKTEAKGRVASVFGAEALLKIFGGKVGHGQKAQAGERDN